MKSRIVRFALMSSALCLGASSGALAGTPLYPPFGYDLSSFDRSTKPGDDFFQYANGAYLARTAIPADRPVASRRLEMTDRMENNVHSLLENAAKDVGDAPTDDKGKVGAFYASFMDQATVDRLGKSAIAAELAAIQSAHDVSAVSSLMGQSNYDFFPNVVGTYIDIDFKDPNRYAVNLFQNGLGLPDRDYYLDEKFAKERTAYRDYATGLFKLLGEPVPSKAADSVIAFETEIARLSWPKEKLRDPTTQYNPMTLAELSTRAPGIDWNALVSGAKLERTTRFIVGQPDSIAAISKLVGSTPVATLKQWMAFRVADQAAPYLSSDFDALHFNFRDKTLQGQEEPRERWKRAMLAVSGGDCGADPASCFGTLNWAVGKLYAAKYFPPEDKARIESLVADVTAAFRHRLETLDWMGPATRAEALKKLDTYTVKVGYPDSWRDYSNVVVRKGDLIGNVRAAAFADWMFYVNRSYGPVDKSDWLMTPQTNDAYNGSLRDIVFPAGILQAPSFDASADPAINYGAIGGVIGHELTHGFDDQGRHIDAAGALRDWWTPADDAAFKARAKMLGDQYARYEPVPGVHIKPDLTMGENIADLGGLTMALDAYRASLKGKPAPVLDGLTGDQRVFLGWAQVWAGKGRPEFIRNITTSDPHSWRKYRVNGVVPNINAWYEAFGIEPGDALYIPPEKRVRIW